MTDIQRILAPDGLAAMTKTGWPEWDVENGFDDTRERVVSEHRRLRKTSSGRFEVLRLTPRGAWMRRYEPSDHEAQCIIKEHWRVWLEERHVLIECHPMPNEPRTYSWTWTLGEDVYGTGYESWVEMLIAAILAVETTDGNVEARP